MTYAVLACRRNLWHPFPGNKTLSTLTLTRIPVRYENHFSSIIHPSGFTFVVSSSYAIPEIPSSSTLLHASICSDLTSPTSCSRYFSSHNMESFRITLGFWQTTCIFLLDAVLQWVSRCHSSQGYVGSSNMTPPIADRPSSVRFATMLRAHWIHRATNTYKRIDRIGQSKESLTSSRWFFSASVNSPKFQENEH